MFILSLSAPLGPYHIETSLYPANQWAGFYMAGTYIIIELVKK